MKRAVDYLRYPLRTCYSMHACAVCLRVIEIGQRYHDGGYGRRAHEGCVIVIAKPGSLLTANERLAEIASIIEAVDIRCLAADGPVTPTLQEMRQDEISRIFALATNTQAAVTP